MHNYLTETLYLYWRWLRDAVLGLVSRPEVPVAVGIVPADRQELFVQLEELRAWRAGEAAQHRHEEEALTARWREVQSAADALHDQLATLQHADMCRSLDHSAAEDRLLGQIKEKSSMSLELFIAEVQGELDALNGIEESIMPRADRNYVTMKKSLGIDSTGPSLKRRAGALIAARRRAEAMRLENLPISAMTVELLRLKKSIPAIEHDTLFTERASIVAHV